MTELNYTHDAAARSWIKTATSAGCDCPIRNLPFTVFRRVGGSEKFRCGVAIGDQIVDLAALSLLGTSIKSKRNQAAALVKSLGRIRRRIACGEIDNKYETRPWRSLLSPSKRRMRVGTLTSRDCDPNPFAGRLRRTRVAR